MLKHPRAAALDGVSGNMRLALAATAVGALALTALAWPQTGLAGATTNDTPTPEPVCTPPGPAPAVTEQVVVPPPCEIKPLRVYKDANTSYDAYFDWTIDKWASSKVVYPDKGKRGATVKYSVDVVKDLVAKKNFEVYGEIKIWNPNRFGVPARLFDRLDGARCEFTLAQNGEAAAAASGEGTVGPGPTKVGYRCFLEKHPDKKLYNVALLQWKDESGKDQRDLARAEVNFWKGARVAEHFYPVDVYDKFNDRPPQLLKEGLTRSKLIEYTRVLHPPKKNSKDDCRRYENTARLFPQRGENNDNNVNGLARLNDDRGKRYSASITVKACNTPPPVTPKNGTKPGTGTAPKSSPAKPSSVLHVSKWASDKRVRVGDIVTWTIKVENTGKAPLANVKVIDRLPRHFQPVGDPKLVPYDRDGRVVTHTFKWIDAGKSRRLKIETIVVGKPSVTTPMRRAARSMGPTEGPRFLGRLRKGIACNFAIASVNGLQAKDGACVKILRKRVYTPQPETMTPVEEIAPV